MDSARASISQGYGRYIYTAVVFTVLAISIYYFYNWINGDGELQSVVLYSSPTSGIDAASNPAVVFSPSTNGSMPPLYEGGEYSVSTWIYVTKWDTVSNKPFLTLSGGSDSTFYTLVMYLGQSATKLGIRVSTDGSTTAAISTSPSANSPSNLDNIQLNSTFMAKLTGNTPSTPFTDSAGDFRKCDIENVDIQRWVNITAVLNGTTLDIYMDGKMARSCVLSSMFKVSGTNGTQLTIGGPSGFGGIIGTTQVANFAYSPAQVYNIYQAGPVDMSVATQIKQWVDPNTFGMAAIAILVITFAAQGLEGSK